MTQFLPASDPLKVFANAERFRAAASYLSQLFRQHGFKEIFIPIQVNAALAVELYMKSLLVLTGSRFIPGLHDLGKLFLQFGTLERAKMIKRFAVLAADDVELAHGSTLDPRYKNDLESLLKDGSQIFEKLRYVHEGLEYPMRGAFTILTKFFRDEIITLQPSWPDESSVLLETSHIPSSLNSNTIRQAIVPPFGT